MRRPRGICRKEAAGRSVIPAGEDCQNSSQTANDSKHAVILVDWEALPAGGELKNPFVDVAKTDYFYDAVLWAYYHSPQVTNSLDATHFGPSESCQRCQIVTFLYCFMNP